MNKRQKNKNKKAMRKYRRVSKHFQDLQALVFGAYKYKHVKGKWYINISKFRKINAHFKWSVYHITYRKLYRNKIIFSNIKK